MNPSCHYLVRGFPTTRLRGVPGLEGPPFFAGDTKEPPIPAIPVTLELHPDRWNRTERLKYSYLLGQYLGDGYVGTIGRTHSLVIACDIQYSMILDEVVEAVSTFSPRKPSILRPKGTNGVRVTSCWKAWPLFFPQPGPGSKLDRKIELADWQTRIVDEHPKAFLRGLIHSDGSRCMNTFQMMLKDGPKEYSYPRYFFTGYSADIQAIFCRSCDRLGIRWTRSNWRNISISHRDSVTLLDQFVGPKSREPLGREQPFRSGSATRPPEQE